MKAPRLLAVGFALAVSARAQVPYAGVTTLVMGLDVSNGIIRAAPASRVRVPPYERVTLVLPDSWTYPIQWRKDDKPVVGATGHTLSIPLATSADSGFYSVTGGPFPFVATGVNLDVVEPGHVGNFSARLELAAGSAPQIVGFVVSGRTPKTIFVRTVGPSLKAFGVAKPAPQPSFRLFDASGRELVFTRPAVVAFDWSDVFTAVGAFPLTGGEKSYDYYTLDPGAYTFQVGDDGKQGGTALLEVYEFPQGTLKASTVVLPVPPGTVLPPVIGLPPPPSGGSGK